MGRSQLYTQQTRVSEQTTFCQELPDHPHPEAQKKGPQSQEAEFGGLWGLGLAGGTRQGETCSFFLRQSARPESFPLPGGPDSSVQENLKTIFFS